MMHVAMNAEINRLFLLIVNNALTAGWVILAVIALRIILKKAPRFIICLFWGMVAFRLLFPFSVESVLSLIPSSQPIPTNIAYAAQPSVDTGLAIVDRQVNPVIINQLAPIHEAGVSPLQIMITFCSAVWLVGVAGMLLYAIVSYVILRKKVRFKAIDTPLILGIFRPQIYLPDGLPLEETEYVLAHEQNHIRRGDHIWKPLGFLILSVYWFQPLVWIAYALFSKDIEYACDEKTTKDRDKTWRADYCQALLNCSAKQKNITACPVAFGEVAVKGRVKSVLSYKKPAFWILCAAVAACIVLVVCFLTNPPKTYAVKVIVPANCVGKFAYSDEEVCAKWSGKITLTAGENLPDTEVMLVATEGTGEMKTIAPFYMTPGMPVQVTLEKDTWYRLCVNVQNETDEPQNVYVNVKGVDLRIADYQSDADARLPYRITGSFYGREADIIIARRDAEYEKKLQAALEEQAKLKQMQEELEEQKQMQETESYPIGISLPQGYSIGAYKEALGLAGGTLIEPVSYHCYEKSPAYEMEDWYYSGFLCKFPAQVLDIKFSDGKPEPDLAGLTSGIGIPLQNHTVRENGMVVGEQYESDGWWYLCIKESHDLFTGALLDSSMQYRDMLQDVDLSQYDSTATYYYYYFVKEGEPFYYYLSLSAKEFDHGQANRIAATVKLPTEQ
ncbi:MAG: hypothetical protein IJ716_05475 [Lachnospiraceae bacterium]|nr:hypothetical protein [Lachnospiraceae bacterium]